MKPCILVAYIASIGLLISSTGCDSKPQTNSDTHKTRVRSLGQSDTATSSSKASSKAKSGRAGSDAASKSSGAARAAANQQDEQLTSGPNTIVTGRVLKPDGSPAADASIELGGYDYNPETGESGSPVVAETSSTADGKYKLVGRGLRSHYVRARLSGYATVQASLVEKTNRSYDAELPALRRFTQDIQLQPTAAIRGHVIDDTNKPVAEATVTFSADSSNPRADKSIASEGITTTSATGDFVLEDIAAGERMLNIDSKNHVPFSEKITAPTSDTLVLRLKTGGAVVNGHAYMKGTGESLSSVTVTMNFQPKDYKAGPRYKLFKAVSDASGAFQVNRLPAGKYILDASEAERGLGIAPTGQDRNTLEIGDKETTTVDLFMYGGHAVTGTVMDKETSAPIEGAKLTAITWGGAGRKKKNSVLSAADGTFRLTGLIPYAGGKSISFQAEKSGYKVAQRSYGSDSISVQVDPDDIEAHRDVQMLKAVKISGLVKTKDNVPVPTASIQVWEQNNYNGDRQGTQVGKDGKYVAEVNRYTMLRVRAEAPGFPACFSDPVQVDDKSVDNVDIILEPGSTVAGKVVDPGGQPVEGADVTATQMVMIGNGGRSDQSGSSKSDANGAFTLTNMPKSISLTAKKEKFASSKSEAVSVDPGGAKMDVVLQLRQSHFIAGSVTNGSGEPVKDVQVSAYSRGNGNGNGNARTEADGHYRIEDLPEGTYYVNAWDSRGGGEQAPSKQNVEVDRSDVDFVFGQKEGVTMIGMVVDDKTGAPIKDFTTNWGSRTSQDKSIPGRFTAKNLTPGSGHLFTIEVQGWPPANFTVQAPKDKDEFTYEFRMGAGGSITGRIIAKADGKPMKDVKIMVWGGESWQRQNSMPQAIATTDDNGKFTATPAASGKNSVTIKPEAPLVTLSKDADVKNGETTDLGDIEIGTGGAIRVKVIRGADETPMPDVAVTLRENSNYQNSKQGKTAADGTYTFPSLGPGNYSVQGTSKPAFNAWAELKGDETKEVVIRLGSNKLVGHATKGGKGVSVNANLSGAAAGENVSRNTQSESDGTFTFDDLPGGSFSVSLNLTEDYNVNLNEKLDIPDTGATLEKTFVFPNGSITGIVTDAAGQPVNTARVAITPVGGQTDIFASNAGGKNVNTDSKGNYTVVGLKSGTYTVTASKTDAGMATQPNVQVADGATKVDLRLEQSGGTVESVALDIADGKPIQKAWCYLNGPNGFLDHGQTRGADGIMKIPNVPPGSYKVQVSAWGYSINEKQIEVKQGETTHIDDVLYGAGSIRWIMKDKSGKPVVGATCRVVPADGNSMELPREGKTDDQGQFTARGMSPGVYNGVAEIAGHAPLTQVFNVKVSSHDEHVSTVE